MQTFIQSVFKNIKFIVAFAVLLVIALAFFVAKKNPLIKNSSQDLLMVGGYQDSVFKPLALLINTDDFSIKQIKFDQFQNFNAVGIHEIRTFTANGSPMIAMGTYYQGNLVVLGASSTKLDDLKVKFEDNFGADERVRALAYGDVTGDGKEDIALGTRPDGILKVYQYDGKTWNGTVIDKLNATIHDILLSDTDGNGRNEIFTTVSTVAKSDPRNFPTVIPEIKRYEFNGKSWDKKTVWKPVSPELEGGIYVHARYLFSGNFDGKGEKEILASVVGGRRLHDLMLLKWNGKDYSEYSQNVGDTLKQDVDVIGVTDLDGDGVSEIVIPTLTSDALIEYKWSGNKWVSSVLSKNPTDENSKNEEIVALYILNAKVNGYKKILYATAGSVAGPANSLKFFTLEYDSVKNTWVKKLVNKIDFPDMEIWGTFGLY